MLLRMFSIHWHKSLDQKKLAVFVFQIIRVLDKSKVLFMYDTNNIKIVPVVVGGGALDWETWLESSKILNLSVVTSPKSI